MSMSPKETTPKGVQSRPTSELKNVIRYNSNSGKNVSYFHKRKIPGSRMRSRERSRLNPYWSKTGFVKKNALMEHFARKRNANRIVVRHNKKRKH